MDLTTLLYLTGASGFFTSRAFIPAFLTAVFLRYGDRIPMLGDLEFIQASGSEPTWFTNNYTIAALGILSLMEVGATKIPEVQEMLDTVHKYMKTGLSAAAAMGVLNTRDIGFIEQTISQAGVLDAVISGTMAVVVYFFSSLRSGFMELLAMSDPDDEVGIRTLISWFEDLWASFGLFLLLIYPVIILTILAVIIGLLWVARKYAEHKEESSKVACPNCNELIYACATACHSCGSEVQNPKDVGFFGQTVDRPAQPGLEHTLRLVSKRRCSKCATRITERGLPQECPTCHTHILGDPDTQSAYMTKVRNRLPKVLGITFLMSLVPVIGIIPGVIYYRLQLIAPFRTYIPAGRGFLLKWLVRILFLVLISLQLVPGFGGFMVPLMAIISYAIYSSYFKSMLSE